MGRGKALGALHPLVCLVEHGGLDQGRCGLLGEIDCGRHAVEKRTHQTVVQQKQKEQA